MPVAIRQLHKHFFGEVSGVDLRKPLTPQEARDIEAGMDKYAVLLFRNQDITDEQQMAVAFRHLADVGFAENMAGHITWQPDGFSTALEPRSDEPRSMYVNPWGLWWQELAASDICGPWAPRMLVTSTFAGRLGRSMMLSTPVPVP